MATSRLRVLATYTVGIVVASLLFSRALLYPALFPDGGKVGDWGLVLVASPTLLALVLVGARLRSHAESVMVSALTTVGFLVGCVWGMRRQELIDARQGIVILASVCAVTAFWFLCLGRLIGQICERRRQRSDARDGTASDLDQGG